MLPESKDSHSIFTVDIVPLSMYFTGSTDKKKSVKESLLLWWLCMSSTSCQGGILIEPPTYYNQKRLPWYKAIDGESIIIKDLAPKKGTYRMVLQLWCTGSITGGGYPVGQDNVFLVFLTKKQDRALLSHVHGKIQPHSTQFWLWFLSISTIFWDTLYNCYVKTPQ